MTKLLILSLASPTDLRIDRLSVRQRRDLLATLEFIDRDSHRAVRLLIAELLKRGTGDGPAALLLLETQTKANFRLLPSSSVISPDSILPNFCPSFLFYEILFDAMFCEIAG